MIIFCICIFLFCGLLLVFSWSEPVGNLWDGAKFMLPFYKAAAFLYQKIRPVLTGYFSGLEASLRKLYPGEKTEEREKKFFVDKMALILFLFLLGTAFMMLSEIKNQDQNSLASENRLLRNTAEDKGYLISLTAESGAVRIDEIDLEVNQRILTEEEFFQSIPEFEDKLILHFLNENEDLNHISGKVAFPDSIEGYPYLVSWSCSDTSIINRDGEIAEDLDKTALLQITAEISYEDYQSILEFPVMAEPLNLSDAEKLKKELIKQIQKNDELSKSQEYLSLPESINGTKIIWTEKKKNNSLLLLILLLVSSFGIFFGKDRDLVKKSEEREKQMLSDYPEIVSKMTLFVDAGMSVRGAFVRIAREYQQNKAAGGNRSYALEEMLITVHEMESGIEERKAYENFANRCHVQKYVKFGALLEQNARIGGRGLLENLDAEAKDALAEKQSQAQQLGEQAGTKLLMPMFLMLGVVIVMIMVPAFMSM